MKFLKYAGIILSGGWVASILLAFLLTAYHFASGSYSYLLDGLIGFNIFSALTGFLFLSVVGTTLTTSPLFFLFFLLAYFIDRKKTVVNPYVLGLSSTTFSFLWGVYSDLALPHNFSLILMCIIVLGTPTVLNIAVFKLSRHRRFMHEVLQ